MNNRDRRKFLVEVGQGMLVALVGPSLAGDMGLASRALGDEGKPVSNDALEPLVRLMQDTPKDKLIPLLKAQLDQGTTLRTLVAAGAVANARAFAGQDYDGYHAFMALAPSYYMASELPKEQQALPVLKVLYRNSSFMHSGEPGRQDRLTPEKPVRIENREQALQRMLQATREDRFDEADQIICGLLDGPLDQTYNDLQPMYEDVLNVHRVVLAWRSWETVDFTGPQHARTLLRQTVRHCGDYKQHGVGREAPPIRTKLPKLMEQYHLFDKVAGTRPADDAWLLQLSKIIHRGTCDQAAEAVAQALAEGFAPDAIGEAMSLAGTQLVLCDRGRAKEHSPQKPVGSVHGDSVGVHASDAANAWRHIAAVSNPRNTHASLIAGAYHTAGQATNQMPSAYPRPEDVDGVRSKDAAVLLKDLEEAIRGKQQLPAAAIVQRYGELGHAPADIVAVMRRFSISEDGALHAEKYYRTTTEEFGRTRPSLRWQHLMSLARVCASAYGNPAPGLAQAKELFKV